MLYSETHVSWARDGVAGLPTHSGSQSGDSHFEFQDSLSATNSPAGERVPARRARESADTAVSSSYFSRVKRPRPRAILLIFDVAAISVHLPTPAYSAWRETGYVFVVPSLYMPGVFILSAPSYSSFSCFLISIMIYLYIVSIHQRFMHGHSLDDRY